MGKQANNLANILPLTYLKYFIIASIAFCGFFTQAQDLKYGNGEKYILGEITVSGNTSFSEQTIVAYSGLRKGKEEGNTMPYSATSYAPMTWLVVGLTALAGVTALVPALRRSFGCCAKQAWIPTTPQPPSTGRPTTSRLFSGRRTMGASPRWKRCCLLEPTPGTATLAALGGWTTKVRWTLHS